MRGNARTRDVLPLRDGCSPGGWRYRQRQVKQAVPCLNQMAVHLARTGASHRSMVRVRVPAGGLWQWGMDVVDQFARISAPGTADMLTGLVSILTNSAAVFEEHMNRLHLGDALDHWKGSLFNLLHGKNVLHDFRVDPLVTDDHWEDNDYKAFAALLHVSSKRVIRHADRDWLDRRQDYFAGCKAGDLFLDPDRGINTGGLSPVRRYVRIREIVELLDKDENRLLFVYQHIGRSKARTRVQRVVDTVRLEHNRCSWCSYEGATVSMLAFSLTDRTLKVRDVFRSLFGGQGRDRIFPE